MQIAIFVSLLPDTSNVDDENDNNVHRCRCLKCNSIEAAPAEQTEYKNVFCRWEKNAMFVVMMMMWQALHTGAAFWARFTPNRGSGHGKLLMCRQKPSTQNYRYRSSHSTPQSYWINTFLHSPSPLTSISDAHHLFASIHSFIVRTQITSIHFACVDSYTSIMFERIPRHLSRNSTIRASIRYQFSLLCTLCTTP